jgi:hypothetical protein
MSPVFYSYNFKGLHKKEAQERGTRKRHKKEAQERDKKSQVFQTIHVKFLSLLSNIPAQDIAPQCKYSKSSSAATLAFQDLVQHQTS